MSVKTPAKGKPKAPRRPSVASVRRVLAEQPLIGLNAAAGVIGIAAPNMRRLRLDGRLPQGVPVEGSASVYFRSEIEALAAEIAKEKGRKGSNGRGA